MVLSRRKDHDGPPDGLSATNIRSADRRDRLLFISAIAQALLTQLGAAGEACGLDRILKTNTVKTRTMSLFNQGTYGIARFLKCARSVSDL